MLEKYILSCGDHCDGMYAVLNIKGSECGIPYFVSLTEIGLEIALSKYLITNELYAYFLKDNERYGYLYENDERFYGSSDKPVVGVRFDYAERYCEWLGDKINMDVGLPTAEEWEYVANKGGEIVNGLNGDGGLYEKLNCNFAYGETTKVNAFPPNKCGIHDMFGNVLEWTCTQDIKDNESLMDKTIAPVRGNKNLKISRLLKGGGWPFAVNTCSVGYSVAMSPRSDYYFIGFRPVIRL